MGIAARLQKKDRMITLTNVCNLSCGGCNQFCGRFRKNFWHVTPKAFKRYVHLIHAKKVFLFGGEPTLNPHLPKILNVCGNFPHINFVLQTNGRKPIDNYPDNVDIWTDYKNRGSHIQYLQTGLAPIDFFKSDSKMHYVKMAFKKCILLKKGECCPSIYNDKAYLCQVAGPLDNLFYNGEHGWKIGKVDPFKKKDADFVKQAMHFCYRCGWAVGGWPQVKSQFTDEPFLVTPTNRDIVNSKCLEKFLNKGKRGLNK